MRDNDAPYVWLEAGLNLLVGAALLAYAFVSSGWSPGLLRISPAAAALVLGGVCLMQAGRVLVRRYRR